MSPPVIQCNAFVIAALCLLLSVPAVAQSLTFQRQIEGNQANLSYQFKDIEGELQQVHVVFARDALLSTPIQFRPLSAHRLQRQVLQQQRAYAQHQGWRNAHMTVRAGQIEYQFVGPGDYRQQLGQWRGQEHAARETVLSQHYYQHLRQHSGRSGYAPDHVRIAQASRDLLRPLATQFHQRLQAQYGDYSPRQALAYLTHFIQQIPYTDLEDRFSSSGAGFATPGRLLFENRGDCDSKVTLLAVLMAELFDEVERRILYLPGHAMFALELTPEDNDIYLRDQGRTFVIADPTGPAKLAVGEAARRYQSHLISGAVTMLAI